MKTVEFQSELRSDHTLSVPEHLLNGLPAGASIRVLVLLPEEAEDQEWECSAATEFGMGYADGDALYDQLSSR